MFFLLILRKHHVGYQSSPRTCRERKSRRTPFRVATAEIFFREFGGVHAFRRMSATEHVVAISRTNSVDMDP
jgi:hypothetical protein